MKKTAFLIILAGLALLSGCISVSQFDQRNKIEVTGKAEFQAVPDQAVVLFEIQTNATSVLEAQRSSTERSRALIEAMTAKGIDKKKIETVQYNIMKNTQWDYEKNKIVDLGYKVVHAMKVTSKDIQNTGELVDSAVIAGVTGVQNVMFELSKEREKEIKSIALENAVRNAKEKAQALADGLNQNLGRAVQVSEISYSIMPFYSALKESRGAPEMEPSIMPQEVNVQVNAAFELR